MPKELKGQASSMNIVISNLLGYVPAPFIYGCINDASKHNNKKLSMTIGILYSFMGFIFCGIATIFRLKEDTSVIGSINEESMITVSSKESDNFSYRKTTVDFSNNKNSLNNLVNMFRSSLGNDLIENEIESTEEGFTNIQDIEQTETNKNQINELKKSKVDFIIRESTEPADISFQTKIN